MTSPISTEPSTQSVRYDWFQSSKSCNVSLFIKNAPKDKVTVKFDSLKVDVEFPNEDGSRFEYSLGPLEHEIDGSKSSFRVFGTKIELEIVKATTSHWSSLVVAPIDNSNKVQTKNWEKLADQVLSTEEHQADDDPNAFFKQIFANADPDARRAMMKSYVESNGTALSTNWEDVKNRTVETMPPEGAESKKW
jgi:suppressor of G2 allele of SKP1